MGHDQGGQRSQLYEDQNVADTIKNAVALNRNLGTTWVPPPQAPRLPWKQITNLKHGALGPLPSSDKWRWVRVMHLSNHFVNDATGVAFPRNGTLAEKLKFCYDEMYPDVSCCCIC